MVHIFAGFNFMSNYFFIYIYIIYIYIYIIYTYILNDRMIY